MAALELSFAAYPSAGRAYRLSPTDDIEELRAYAAFARLILRQRRRREKWFGISGFADPAWDMLLDLFGFMIAGEDVSKSGLVASAGLPQSTGLRWVSDLIAAGVFHPYPDPADGRRMFVAMDEEMFRRMARALRAVRADFRQFLAQPEDQIA